MQKGKNSHEYGTKTRRSSARKENRKYCSTRCENAIEIDDRSVRIKNSRAIQAVASGPLFACPCPSFSRGYVVSPFAFPLRFFFSFFVHEWVRGLVLYFYLVYPSGLSFLSALQCFPYSIGSLATAKLSFFFEV